MRVRPEEDDRASERVSRGPSAAADKGGAGGGGGWGSDCALGDYVKNPSMILYSNDAGAGCLFPRLTGVAALSSFVICADWIREIDVSNNDLRGEGTAILCSALRKSSNALDTLRICNNQISRAYTTMAPPNDFSDLWDGRQNPAEAASATSPGEHKDFVGHRARHNGYLTSMHHQRPGGRPRGRCEEAAGDEAQGAADPEQQQHERDVFSRRKRSPDGRPSTASSCGWASPLPRGLSPARSRPPSSRPPSSRPLALQEPSAFRSLASGWNGSLTQCGGVGYGEGEGEEVNQLEAAEELAALVKSKSTLTSLALSNNQLGDDVLALIVSACCEARALTCLDLSFNSEPSDRRSKGCKAGASLKMLVEKVTSLTQLDLSWNALTEESGDLLGQGLCRNSTLTSLNLSSNSLGRHKAMQSLAAALSEKERGTESGPSRLRHLDLANNAIDIEAAYLLAGGLEHNRTLQRLVLDQNQLTQVGARVVQMAGVREDHVTIISMSDCSLASSDTGFDNTEPAGTYQVDLSRHESWHVLKSLVRTVKAGNGAFVGTSAAPMLLNSKPYTKFRVARRKASSPRPGSPASPVEVEAINAEVDKELAVLPDKGILEFNFGSLWKPPRMGQELSEALFEKMMREFSSSALTIPAAKDILASVMHGNVMSSAQVNRLLTVTLDSELRLLVLHAVFNKISDPQRKPELLKLLLPTQRRDLRRRTGTVSWFFTANNPTGHYNLNLGRPTDREVALILVAWKNREQEWESEQARKQQGRVGGTRDKALDRVWRNAMYNGKPRPYDYTWALPRSGTLRLDFVQITKPTDDLNAEDIKIISNDDIVELVASLGDPFHKDPVAFVAAVREASNGFCFTTEQCKYLLLELTKAIVVQERFSPILREKKAAMVLRRWSSKTHAIYFTMWRMGLVLDLKRIPSLREAGAQESVDSKGKPIPETAASKKRFEKYEDLRVELIVIMFARIVDHLGFRHSIYEKLSAPEQVKLCQRLGDFNLFCEDVAVGMYELSLDKGEHRRIMQEILHLSTREPGKSFVDVQYNDKMDFGIPESWKKGVPDKGWISFCYCRESEVVERIKAQFVGSHAWPERFSERSGREWVKHMRIRIIQQKLIKHFGNSPLSGFQAIDRDGGGSLDRTEVAVGLFKLGLWLSPQEINALMSVLDENEDNDITYNEWVYFWKLHVDLDTGTLRKDEEVIFPAADSPREEREQAVARTPSQGSEDVGDSLSADKESNDEVHTGGVGARRGIHLELSLSLGEGVEGEGDSSGEDGAGRQQQQAERVGVLPGAGSDPGVVEGRGMSSGQLGPLPPLA